MGWNHRGKLMDSVGYTWISHGGWVPSKFQRKSVHPVAIVVTCDYQKIETKSRNGLNMVLAEIRIKLHTHIDICYMQSIRTHVIFYVYTYVTCKSTNVYTYICDVCCEYEYIIKYTYVCI